MSAIKSDPTGKTDARFSKEAKVIVFIGLPASWAIVLAYVFVPLFLQGQLCPPMTVWSEASGSIPVIVFGMLLLVAAAFIPIVRYGTRFSTRRPAQVRHFPSPIVVAALCGVSALIWVNYLESYNCITPNQILIKPGLFGSAKSSGWQDVTEVRAECSGRGNYLYGDVRLILLDGTAITVPLRTSRPDQDYEIVRATLSGRHYEYRLSATVTPNLCPPAVYPLLTNWQHR